ncbi:DUF3558 family protein [Saccharomonospora glauca]|uniref:DUF3558 family protein n=1 Tax=Saccharomonospora glauca TaxID=40990 RepID=UPI0009FE4050|nr:DUF3558 family protein [Saccharomonospora glauca]
MMSFSRKGLSFLFPLTLAGVVAAGCGQEESGSASVATEDSFPVSSPQGSTSNKEVNSPVDPCALLSASEIAQYGDFNSPEKSKLDGDPVCSWSVSKSSVEDVEAPIVDLTYIADLDVDDVVDLGNGVESASMENGREVVRMYGFNSVIGTPDCLIAMEIRNGSRLDVMVSRTADPCGLAEKVVELVDPKLPRG